MSDDQGPVLALLGDAAAYPHPAPDVVHLQTHISHVFLAGAYAYKVKKPVTFPFLDFGTLERRERCCLEEVRLNRRLAAPVYLDVVAVTRGPQGLRIGGDGTVVEWAVRMRRLPADRTLAALLASGRADAETVTAVAGRIADFHAAAAPAPGGDPDALRAAWRENLAGVRSMVPRFIDAERFALLEDFGDSYVVRHDTVLRARAAGGRVRDGHGDLRADHVYVLDAPLPALPDAPAVPAGIQIVDCVEFSAAFRAVDGAADLSFLAMELEALGRPDLARALVARYAEAADDPVAPALVPYHAAHRAVVRGKVEALAAAESEIAAADRERAAARSRLGFALAERFAWRSGDPVVVACTGLSGSGKSAVAAVVGDASGWPVLSSDVFRRDDAPPRDRRYGATARAAVYARLRREVERTLGAGESAVVDATFIARAERDRLARTVRGFGRRLVFVECVADEAVVRRRLDARDASSVSEARWDVYVAQRGEADPLAPDEPRLGLDTSGTVDEARRRLLPRLWAWRQGRSIAA